MAEQTQNALSDHKFMLINARSIKTCTHNANELLMYLQTFTLENPAVFGVTETWLNDNISDVKRRSICLGK